MLLGQTLVVPAVFPPTSIPPHITPILPYICSPHPTIWLRVTHQHHTSSHVLGCDFLFRALYEASTHDGDHVITHIMKPWRGGFPAPPPTTWRWLWTRLCLVCSRSYYTAYICLGFFFLALRLPEPLYCFAPVGLFAGNYNVLRLLSGWLRFAMTTRMFVIWLNVSKLFSDYDE